MFPRHLRQREHNPRVDSRFESRYQVTSDFISRLGLERELRGHEGCVNCIQWNQHGNVLASGSDDFKLILWDPFVGPSRNPVRQTLSTGHQGNIFSLKFIPFTGDSILASGAGDNQVRVHDATKAETIHVFNTHCGRVKRIEVAQDEPHLVWSAGEDGLVIQFDLRCPSSSAASVLVNLNGLLGKSAEVKCVSVNPVRNELLAIGANDPYVRLYDRRRIKTQDVIVSSVLDGLASPHSMVSEYSARKHIIPTGSGDGGDYCQEQYVAGHLPAKQSYYKKRLRPLAATYLTFSPNGKDLLVNLGGEQIYLFTELSRSEPVLTHYQSLAALSALFDQTGVNGITGSHIKSMPADIMEMKLKANGLYDRKLFNQAIEVYNTALEKTEHPVLFANRAAALMKRSWDGDMYGALRDCHDALKLDRSNVKAHLRVVRCLLELGLVEESNSYLGAFKATFPEHSNSPSCVALDNEIQRKLKNAASTAETNGRRRRRSSSNEDATGSSTSPTRRGERKSPRQDNGLRSFLSGSSSSSSNSPGSPPPTPARDHLDGPRSAPPSYDYYRRYCGHCNTTTDIKEANFFGRSGSFIVAGSDDGKFFIWDRESTNIVKILTGDDSIVNCLQGHPSACLLATSGIESTVKLWSPQPEDRVSNDRVVEDSDTVASANQRRMNADPFETLLINMGYNIQQAAASGGNRMNSSDDEGPGGGETVQCRQS